MTSICYIAAAGQARLLGAINGDLEQWASLQVFCAAYMQTEVRQAVMTQADRRGFTILAQPADANGVSSLGSVYGHCSGLGWWQRQSRVCVWWWWGGGGFRRGDILHLAFGDHLKWSIESPLSICLLP